MDGKGTLDLLQDEFLSCDICQDQMQTPKELPCLHSFCLDCLQRTASSSGLGPGDLLSCPSCRNEVPVPPNGVTGFPTNFNLTRLTQIVSERRKARRRKPPAQLVSALSSMQETIHKAKETRDQLKKRYREIHHRKQKCVRDIEARRDYMMTLVHDYVKVMLNNVEVTYSEEMEELNKNLEVLESQIAFLQKGVGVGLNDPKQSPIQTLRNQLDKVTSFANNLSTLEETLKEVNSTPYADFKPGIASSYVMEQVFGKLHVTTQQEIDDVMAQRRASLIDIPEGESATVVNYFSCGQADDDVECYVTDFEVLPSGEIVCVDADNHCAKVFYESGQPKLSFGKQVLKRPDKITSLPAEQTNMLSRKKTSRGADKKCCKILITDLEEECIFQFDQNGVLMSRFPSPVNNPTAICSTRDRNLLVSDWKTKTVHIVSELGEHLHTFPTDMTWPVYVAACGNGNIVVSDWKSHCVRVFDTFGTRVCDYNNVGSEEGQIHRPNGVTCDANGFIYLADMKNCRVHLLSPEGAFVRFVATKDNGIRRPTGVKLNQKGELLIADLKGTISILSVTSQDDR